MILKGEKKKKNNYEPIYVSSYLISQEFGF